MLEVMLERGPPSDLGLIEDDSLGALQLGMQRCLNKPVVQYTMLALIFLDFLLGFASVVLISVASDDSSGDDYEAANPNPHPDSNPNSDDCVFKTMG